MVELNLDDYVRIANAEAVKINIRICRYKVIDNEILFETKSICSECEGYDIRCRRYRE